MEGPIVVAVAKRINILIRHVVYICQARYVESVRHLIDRIYDELRGLYITAWLNTYDEFSASVVKSYVEMLNVIRLC